MVTRCGVACYGCLWIVATLLVAYQGARVAHALLGLLVLLLAVIVIAEYLDNLGVRD